MSKNSQQLPQKENNLFKQIVKFYETKCYKKGIKAADAILKKYPEHGETLAMKGLTLNCLERKEDAYKLVREGLKQDLGSHVCWHVYGLLYRSDRNYREAIKCYQNALRLDKENSQILRDLSLLQVQMRDRTDFVETRRQLLTLKSSNRVNWIAFAVAHHLAGSYELAVQVLDSYEGTIEGEIPYSERYEHSEMLLYRTTILEESGKVDEALASLDKAKEQVVDTLSFLAQRARLLIKKGDAKGAEATYRELIEINPDNHRYHEGLHIAMDLAPSESGYTAVQVAGLKALYEGLAEQYPKSAAVKRIPLESLEGADFQAAAEMYVLRFLQKGIPSLFSDLKSLYVNPAKVEILNAMFESAADSLKKTSKLPFSCAKGAEEDPSVLVWTLFFLAQHYDRRGMMKKAVDTIDTAIRHTPTIPDLYLCKARIMKNTGDGQASWQMADEARQMDLSDRYLNSECTLHMLDADMVTKAQETISLFTKDGDNGDNLHEMQCIWYETAAGNSHLRTEQYGKALRQLLAVGKHFEDIVEDQFDFHTYCLRKMTLRTYVELLKMEEHVHNHRFYVRAACGALRGYLGLADQEVMGDAESKAANEEGRKERKARQQFFKEQAKKDEEEKALKALKDKESGEKKKNVPGAKPAKEQKTPAEREKEEEETCIKLATVADPLGETSKTLALLQEHALDRLETHFLAFEVYLRRGKMLLALRALRRMRTLSSAQHPATHACTVRLFHKAAVAGGEDYGTTVLKGVLVAEAETLLKAPATPQSLVAYNSNFVGTNSKSLRHVAAGAEMMALLEPAKKQAAIDLLMQFTKTPVDEDKPSLERRDLQNVCELLRVLKDTAASQKWKVFCSKQHPLDPQWQAAASS